MSIDLRAIIDDYENLPGPVLYHRNKMCAFEIVESGPHRFGGHLPAVSGAPDGAVLHALLTIAAQDCEPIAEASSPGLPVHLPMIFPIQHDSGTITYQVAADGSIEIKNLKPTKADASWPYDDYPNPLPARAVKALPAIAASTDDLERLAIQSVPNQDEIGDHLACVIVPPSSTYGVSLWGPDGDAEMVQCIFSIDMRTGAVYAQNQCS